MKNYSSVGCNELTPFDNNGTLINVNPFTSGTLN
jgi:hypothetical protein